MKNVLVISCLALWYRMAGLYVGCTPVQADLDRAEGCSVESDAIKEAEAKSKELLLETRDQLLKEQQQQEREAENEEVRCSVPRDSSPIEENLERIQAELDANKRHLGDVMRCSPRRVEDRRTRGSLLSELEKIAGIRGMRQEAIID
jgi:ribonuclease Y